MTNSDLYERHLTDDMKDSTENLFTNIRFLFSFSFIATVALVQSKLCLKSETLSKLYWKRLQIEAVAELFSSLASPNKRMLWITRIGSTEWRRERPVTSLGEVLDAHRVAFLRGEVDRRVALQVDLVEVGGERGEHAQAVEEAAERRLVRGVSPLMGHQGGHVAAALQDEAGDARAPARTRRHQRRPVVPLVTGDRVDVWVTGWTTG